MLPLALAHRLPRTPEVMAMVTELAKHVFSRDKGWPDVRLLGMHAFLYYSIIVMRYILRRSDNPLSDAHSTVLVYFLALSAVSGQKGM